MQYLGIKTEKRWLYYDPINNKISQLCVKTGWFFFWVCFLSQFVPINQNPNSIREWKSLKKEFVFLSFLFTCWVILRLAADMTVCLVLVAVRMAESLGTARSATRYIVGLEIIKMHKAHGGHYLLCFFLKILKYSGLWSFSVFPLCQCVYTNQAGRTPALQQNWQSLKKSQSFKEKTQYIMNTL